MAQSSWPRVRCPSRAAPGRMASVKGWPVASLASKARFQDEFSNGTISYSLPKAQILIEPWRKHYNTKPPHSERIAIPNTSTRKHPHNGPKANQPITIKSNQSAGDGQPVFIFIDELDSRQPGYAVEVLEEIKHLFETPGYVFVLAMQKQHLTASISALYRMEFNAASYLDRFIDKVITPRRLKSHDLVAMELEKNLVDQTSVLSCPLELSSSFRKPPWSLTITISSCVRSKGH